jgi:CubicO group peptidase (beta-lactamase class C family)/tRNA A-37 threonylcarbamoyl transferase component Bud32
LGGWALPSVQIAFLAATLVMVLYTLVPEGRWRQRGKLVATGVVALAGLGRIALGAEAPSDVLVGAAIGVAIPLMLFRLFAPNQVFPIRYRRGRAAHLDVTGPRGEAIRRGLEDQLGIQVAAIRPFGLSGSAGSTPLRITVKGDPPTDLFGKLYARSHLRADRSYKLARELLYGQLEDEKPFNTVRRLVQQEDYALRLCRDAGLPTPRPYGVVELTPEREYLLVTEFFADTVELGEAEVDDQVIDDGLSIIRRLWHAGLAHRDIKPANLLVRDGRLLLIDVAFVELRPTPWRQAVDLANMMLCLALRSSPEQVYQRALRQFTVEEISEGFAAARGLALPSQLRRMLRAQGRDVHAEFLRLLPSPPRPIPIQRWSLRRVGLLAAMVLLLVLVFQQGLQLDYRQAVETTTDVGNLACSDLEPQWLLAQSVPSAWLVPCVEFLPAGWSFGEVAVNDGRSVIRLHHDRGGTGVLVIRLTAACDTPVGTPLPSDQRGVQRWIGLRAPGEVARFDLFSGGCVTAQATVPAANQDEVNSQLNTILRYTSRAALQQALGLRSDGRLRLNPPNRLTQEQALAALADHAAERARADEFAGAVLVARHGTVLLEDAWGRADRKAGVANTSATRFRIGSMNKMFTAVATLQLVEAHKLALDDPIGKHLPDYPNKQVAAKVTARHLLTHTGGTGDIFGPEFDHHRRQLREHRDYLKLYGRRGLNFEPGARFEYSNYGFVLLGALIEHVSGESYDDYVRDHVFRPAGMRSTGALPEAVEVPDRAVGYTRLSPTSAWEPNTDTLPWRGTAAGGGYSTVGDLLRFAQALSSGRLISTATLAEATRPHQPQYGYGFDVQYGYGFDVQGQGRLRGYGHGGGADGMNGELRIFPELGYVVVGLSNLDPPAASELVEFFTLRMPDR